MFPRNDNGNREVRSDEETPRLLRGEKQKRKEIEDLKQIGERANYVQSFHNRYILRKKLRYERLQRLFTEEMLMRDKRQQK